MIYKFIAVCLHVFAFLIHPTYTYVYAEKNSFLKCFFMLVFSGDSVDKFLKCRSFKLLLYFLFQKICCRLHMWKCFINCKVLYK